jgi:hypothetical protein
MPAAVCAHQCVLAVLVRREAVMVWTALCMPCVCVCVRVAEWPHPPPHGSDNGSCGCGQGAAGSRSQCQRGQQGEGHAPACLSVCARVSMALRCLRLCARVVMCACGAGTARGGHGVNGAVYVMCLCLCPSRRMASTPSTRQLKAVMWMWPGRCWQPEPIQTRPRR